MARGQGGTTAGERRQQAMEREAAMEAKQSGTSSRGHAGPGGQIP
jgi:hypothetical protein